MSRLFGVPVSFAKPFVVTVTVALWATAEVKVNPLTCFGTLKFPLPHVGFVHVTLVLLNVGVQFRLFVVRLPAGKSVEVGAPAPVTPVSPVNVIVVGLVKRSQLSNGANVRLYVHVV